MTDPLAGLGLRIKRESTTEQVGAALREAILTGRIPPGTPLREVALAAELGVSRNTIREAARILGSEGLVRYQMNRGIVVTDVTDSDITDIYAARAAVEMAGVEALAARPDPAIFAALAEFVDRIEHAFDQGDAAGVLDGDRSFHATLVAAAGSARLSRFHTQLQQEQRLALALAERSSRELGRKTDDHRALLSALQADPALAKTQLTAHLQTGAAELRQLRKLLGTIGPGSSSR